MKTIFFITALAMGFTAHADGFKCETGSGLVVQIYNHTLATDGTRTGSVMVISDSKIHYGNKTIAKFTAEKKTLTSKALSYVAKVDLRVSESNRKGELLAGTKLGNTAEIAMTVNFSYNQPAISGALMAGELAVLKRDGSVITEAAVCERYLKN